MHGLNTIVAMNDREVLINKVKSLKDSNGFQRQRYLVLSKKLKEKYGISV